VPIFLDQTLRKALLSKIRDSFGRDEGLAGRVRVLDQETFLPEAENQVIMTDLQVANESLDASNRVTELSGRVTFAPLTRPDTSFLFWAQENPEEPQIMDHGFYELTLHKVALQTPSPSAPDTSWELQVEAIKRVTEKRQPWSGLRIVLGPSVDLSTVSMSDLTIRQSVITLEPHTDFSLVSDTLYLKRYDPHTYILYKGVDITDECSFLELVSNELTFTTIAPPIQLPEGVCLESVSVFNLTLNRPLSKGWSVTQSGKLIWDLPTHRGTSVLIQYYQKTPLRMWDLPKEFQFPLESTPLTYSTGKSSLLVVSNLRGALDPSTYEIRNLVLRILEPLPNEALTVDYRFHFKSLGQFRVDPASITCQIIPGISLTFTDNFSDGDRAVVIKHDQVKNIGQENGGTNKVELSLKLRSADDLTLERMTARVFFLFTDQISLFELTNQGVSLENSVSYARSYEERDGNADKWAVNTFRLTIHHTWRYLIPYVSDLNTLDLATGFIEVSGDTGAPTFRELIVSTTKDSWIQAY